MSTVSYEARNSDGETTPRKEGSLDRRKPIAAVRTNLALDDDILAAARHLAEREHKSVGEVISNLTRLELSRSTRSSKTERNGIPLLPSWKAAVPVTLELVN